MGYEGWSMMMSAFDIETHTSAQRARPQSESAESRRAQGGVAQPSDANRQVHAQESDRVYQAAGDQYFLDHAVPAPAAPTNTLPRDTAAFTGRGEELDGLIGMVTRLVTARQTIPIVLIDGMAGVGKTTFAVHAAHRLSPNFPDGQMFVDLHAHSAGKVPVEPADALFALLSVDGVSVGDIPADADGRSALWRARIAGRHAILILDNVTGHRQVESLLPGAAGCLVMVTSRRRLTGLGARHAAVTVPLHPLQPDNAADLFIRLADRTSAAGQERAVMELVRLCGCLPLAIALLAARLRPEPQWRVQTLADDLVAARDRLAVMRAEDIQIAAAFDLSYRCLPAARRRFFRRLGLSPGMDIDAYAAAALDEVDLATARRQLDALYDDHLLEQPVQGRYRLHDLLGVYARALVAGDAPTQRDAAVRRLLDYYEYAAGLANRYLEPRPRQMVSAVAPTPPALPAIADATAAAGWMEAELPNLLGCATRAMNDGDEIRLIGLSTVLSSFLRRAGPSQQSLSLHRAAAEAARRRGDQSGQAAALHHMGVLLRRAGDYPAATAVLNQAGDVYRSQADRVGEAEVLTAAGIVRRLAGDHTRATAMLDQALALFRESGDAAGQAEVLAELAVIQWLADDHAAATRFLDQALALYRGSGNRLGQADVLLFLGMVRRLTHDYPVATRVLRQALSLYRGAGDRVGIAHTEFSLGVVGRLVGDYRGAAQFLDESLRIYREIGDRLGRANALREFGILRRLTGDYPGAGEALTESWSIYRDLGNRRGQAESLQEVGVVRWLTGKASRAADDLAEALAIYRDLDSRAGQAEVLNHLGKLLLDAGDPQAQSRFQAALELAREAQNPLEEARALEGAGRCSLRQRETDQAVRQLHEAAEVYQRIGAPEAAQVRATLTSLGRSRHLPSTNTPIGRRRGG
jgi:tetratricopeptide (TPR) repeat protein